MRYRHAVTETGGTESFAREQIIGHGRTGNAAIVFEHQAGLLECAFLAGDFQVEHHVVLRQEFGEISHVCSELCSAQKVVSSEL